MNPITVYSYILIYNNKSFDRTEKNSKQAWEFIKQIGTSGCTFGRGIAGSFYFNSTWERETIATVLNTYNMEFVLFCINDHSSSIYCEKDKLSGIDEFFKDVLKIDNVIISIKYD